MRPLLLIANPLAEKIQDAKNTQLTFKASSHSLWVLAGLGLVVVFFFVYLYVREWWLERGFRRYRISMAREESGPRPTQLTALRKPLLSSTPAAGKEDANGEKGVRVHSLAVRAVVPHNHSRPNRASSTMALKPARGLVLVQAEDPFHEIYVDDSFVGNAPARLNLAEGSHWIEIRRAGHKTYRRELQVLAGAEVNLRVLLEKSNLGGELQVVAQDRAQRG